MPTLLGLGRGDPAGWLIFPPRINNVVLKVRPCCCLENLKKNPIGSWTLFSSHPKYLMKNSKIFSSWFWLWNLSGTRNRRKELLFLFSPSLSLIYPVTPSVHLCLIAFLLSPLFSHISHLRLPLCPSVGFWFNSENRSAFTLIGQWRLTLAWRGLEGFQPCFFYQD